MPPIRVESDDTDTGSWVSAWIHGLALDPPVDLAMRIKTVESLPPPADTRAPFLQPRVEIRAGPPGDDLAIEWLGGAARASLHRGSRIADVTLGRSALEGPREEFTQTFLVAVLVFLLRRAGWHHIHGAGARDPSGRDWLLAGDARAGKSTTAALLATRGWGVGTDDLTFLEARGGMVEAIAPRAPIALRDGGYELLALSGGAAARGGRKKAFLPEELGGSFAERVRPAILALPRVAGRLTSVELIRPREALRELVRWSAWVALEPDLAQDHLDLLTALARQARCYRIALGPDLFAGRDLLMELIP